MGFLVTSYRSSSAARLPRLAGIEPVRLLYCRMLERGEKRRGEYKKIKEMRGGEGGHRHTYMLFVT